jgi:outer membrane immunogenic protein
LRHTILLAASVLALVAASSANAADVVVEEPAPPPVAEVPIFTWTGGYIGIQGGYVWSDVDVGFADGTSFSGDFDGGLAGGYVGYNWQSGAFVFGAEGDFNGVWNDETFTIGGVDVEVGTDYLASLRGRVGYAIDRTLIFATAGVAFTQMSAEADLGGGLSLDADQDFTGWTVGAGVEYAFTDNWIGRAEYRYYDFGNEDIDGFGDAEITNNTVTVGVAYKW